MCTIWRVVCFYAQYTFLVYRLGSVLFPCTVHISNAQRFDVFSNRIIRSVARGFVLLALFSCDIHVVKSVSVLAEICNLKFVSL
jgi:hypothetical protein